MRVLGAVTLGVVFLVPGAASAERSQGPREGLLPPLTTTWPARDDCPSYANVEVSVDDRVSAVEWRGPDGTSLILDLPKLPGREGTETYRLGSDGMDCHVGQSSCILYGGRVERMRSVRVARTSQPLPGGFVPGRLDELVLRDDVRGVPPSRTNRSLQFGLRLILHCADQSKPSVAWACDARSCVPRTFRNNVGLQAARTAEEAKPARQRRYKPPVGGPYGQMLDAGDPARDLGRLICMRGAAGRAHAVREAGEDAYCWGGAMTAVEGRAALVELARDLLVELDKVLDEGCAGSCSARVDDLRATARALGAAPDLRLRGVRTAFHPGDEDDPVEGALPSLGIVAKLVASQGAVEVACARYKSIGSAGEPVVRACRLSVYARGRRLADYAPDWRQNVELPDSGAIHISDLAPTGDDPHAGHHDHVVIIGSALTQRARHD